MRSAVRWVCSDPLLRPSVASSVVAAATAATMSTWPLAVVASAGWLVWVMVIGFLQ
jgi:hypothetical protein